MRSRLRIEGLVDIEEVGVSPEPRRRLDASGIALVVIVAIGLIVRVTGWSNGGLFYDDAWFALPARVDLSTATHMIVTAPGFTLLERGWIQLFPTSARWALALPLLLGVIAPIALFGLGRLLGFRRWICAAIAAGVAAAPAAIEYSTRVKEYEADLLLAAGLLALVEVARRQRSRESLAFLAAGSVLAVATSTSLAPVAAACWMALGITALLDRRRRGEVLCWGTAAAAVIVPIVGVVASRLPPALGDYWVASQRLLGAPWNPSRVVHTLALTAGGLAHGFIGTPMPATFPRVIAISSSEEMALVALGVIEGLVLVAVSIPIVTALWRRRMDARWLVALPSLLTVVTSVVLFAAGRVPLGTGRTDLVLLPGVLVLAAVTIERLADRVASWREGRAPSWTRLGLAVAIVLGACVTGLAWHQRSWYPTQAVGALKVSMDRLEQPGDVLVITDRNAFPWAFGGLSRWSLHLSATSPRSSTIGYWVSFDSPRVLSQEPHGPAAVQTIADLTSVASSRRLWLVGTTDVTYSPSAFHLRGAAGGRPTDTGATAELKAAGWRPVGTTVRADGVFAQLFERARPAGESQ